MEKEVYKSKYAIAIYNEQSGIYTAKYLLETENMRDDEWKQLMHELLDVNERIKPKFVIDDNTQRHYSYPPDIQAWTLGLYVECWNRNGLKKYVQIVPDNIIGQITAEQIVELANSEFHPLFENKYVKTYTEAIDWINE
jgi:hypothetical protein